MFFFSSRRRHTRCALVTGVQKCALPIFYLYYIGWNPGSTVRMHLFGGLAVSTDGGRSFERASRAPVIERCAVNPYLNTAPFVLHEDGNWRMYYVTIVRTSCRERVCKYV